MNRSLRALSSSLLLLFAAACSSQGEDIDGLGSEIVDVPHTAVERQSIGNCWLYAHASWVESMHKTATGEDFDVSQSYWTYWHWFDQIVDEGVSQIETGGFWSTANDLVRKYGIMSERDFVSDDARNEMSQRQADALAAIDRALSSGALRDPAARRDRRLVRRELDRAWRLSSGVKRMLDDVFGADVSRDFESTASSAGSKIVAAKDFEVAYTTGPGQPLAQKTLLDATREWREARFYSGWNEREYFLRVQKAMHDAQPVLISWFVDFNALENRPGPLRGSFNMTTLNENGPGHQGGHMTVLEDYEAKLADGTVLKAGVTLDPSNPEDARKLAAALEPDTEISFLRIKNSWGGARPDRAFVEGMPGYHDLYTDYLIGPVRGCATRPDGETDTTNCYRSITPLQDVVLPPGY